MSPFLIEPIFFFVFAFRCLSLSMLSPWERFPPPLSATQDRWELLRIAEWSKCLPDRLNWAWLGWPDLGQTGGGAGPDCYLDQPAINASGGGNTIWECFLDDSLRETVLSWCTPFWVLMYSNSHCNTSWSLWTYLATALSICRLAGDSCWVKVGFDQTLMTHAKPWDIISEQCWLRPHRPAPSLAYKLNNIFLLWSKKWTM